MDDMKRKKGSYQGPSGGEEKVKRGSEIKWYCRMEQPLQHGIGARRVWSSKRP
jgi:hypothetical protein